MMKNSGQLLKGIMSYIALQHKFWVKRILLNEGFFSLITILVMSRLKEVFLDIPYHRKMINIIMTMENFIMVRDNLFCSQYVRISCGMTVLINVTSNPCTVAVRTAVSIQCSVLHPPITIWLIFLLLTVQVKKYHRMNLLRLY